MSYGWTTTEVGSGALARHREALVEGGVEGVSSVLALSVSSR